MLAGRFRQGQMRDNSRVEWQATALAATGWLDFLAYPHNFS
jgi:hypothetical protein